MIPHPSSTAAPGCRRCGDLATPAGWACLDCIVAICNEDPNYRAHQVRAAAPDLLAALRLTAQNYPPCDQCGAVAAEWWRCTNGDAEEGPDMTALCTDCAGALADVSQPAEPADHIAAIVKVRHLLGKDRA